MSRKPQRASQNMGELGSARALNILLCETGDRSHDVNMEWQMRGGMRTGALVAYCGTCRRVVPIAPQPKPSDYNRTEYFRAYMQKRRLLLRGVA